MFNCSMFMYCSVYRPNSYFFTQSRQFYTSAVMLILLGSLHFAISVSNQRMHQSLAARGLRSAPPV